MSTLLPASFSRWLFCCAALIAIAISSTASAQTPPPKISVRMWVIEVETDKLRNLGFEWNQIKLHGETTTTPISTASDLATIATQNADLFQQFMKPLEQNSLARTLAEPTLVTLSGRKASLQVGQQTKLEVTPTAVSDQRVELRYKIEVGNETEASTSPHLLTGSTVQTEAGKLCVISQTRSSVSAAGKRRQTEVLLLVQADYLSH